MRLKESTVLLDHQDLAVSFFEKSKYVLCGDEMGLGKTLESLAFAIKNSKPYDQILVVSPAFLKYNWQDECSKFAEGLAVQVVNNLKDLEKARFADVIIINYERLEMCASLFAVATTVIADEAHYLKNVEAKRTDLFHRFVKMYQPENLILLTGTPVSNAVSEFYSLLKILSYCPHGTNGKNITHKFKSEYEFAKYFSNESIIQFKQFSPKWNKQITVKKSVFTGLRNEQELKSYFVDKYIRRLTEQVITLPEMDEQFVQVNYKSKDTALEKLWEAFNSTNSEKLSEALMTLKRKSAETKAKFTADFAKNKHIETGEQVVIFSDHKNSTQLIAEKLKVPFITGETPLKKRDAIIKRFVSGDIKYFVATIGSASTGINLVNSPFLVFNDSSYKPSSNAQAKKRVHRYGQKKSVMIYHIVGSIIDEKISKSNHEKNEVIKRIV